MGRQVKIVRCGAADRARERKVLAYLSYQLQKIQSTRRGGKHGLARLRRLVRRTLIDFLEYLRVWKESTKNRPGKFTHNARGRIFLSWQKYEGIEMTAHPAIESTKFLLQDGTEFVLAERFCQDPVEEYFGNQRKLGRRSGNPDIHAFGYNAKTLRIQRTVSCQSGNTRGRSGNTRGRKDKRRVCWAQEWFLFMWKGFKYLTDPQPA